MTKAEFLKACSSGGYCSKKVALEYAGDREEFTEEDIEQAFRYAQERTPHSSGGKWHSLAYGSKTTKRYTVV